MRYQTQIRRSLSEGAGYPRDSQKVASATMQHQTHFVFNIRPHMLLEEQSQTVLTGLDSPWSAEVDDLPASTKPAQELKE